MLDPSTFHCPELISIGKVRGRNSARLAVGVWLATVEVTSHPCGDTLEVVDTRHPPYNLLVRRTSRLAQPPIRHQSTRIVTASVCYAIRVQFPSRPF